MKKLLVRFLGLFAACIILVTSTVAPAAAISQNNSGTAITTQATAKDYPFVFVHGFSGWGEYESLNKLFNYWGMGSGNLLGWLNKQGYDCCAASVDPYASCWERTCELYAQLTGTVVDYGAAHSQKYKHKRYGESFVGKAIVNNWSETDKINLVAHSFGGTTCRLLIELLVNGNQEEINATPAGELSGLFSGGKSGWVYSLTTLATPHNGTSAIGYLEGLDVVKDTSFYDMSINGAKEMNDKLNIQPDIYYFSYAGCKTKADKSGNQVPQSSMVFFFKSTSLIMGSKKLNSSRSNGRLDASWLQNDGLVNTVSAIAPFDEPQVTFNVGSIQKGVWNVMPTQSFDHLQFTGGVFNMDKDDTHDFYMNMLSIITSV